jgi:adenine phosphoribosyltransferase
MQNKIQSLIRTIPDYPKPGILFRDITTLLKDANGLQTVVDGLAEAFVNQTIDKVVGIEARGFIIGAALAYKLGVGFVPIRKAGNLPAEKISASYQLEYGSDAMELHIDAINHNERILLIDDLTATGGTAKAALQLIERLGGNVIACGFVVSLPDLGGVKQLQASGLQVVSLCAFDGH